MRSVSIGDMAQTFLLRRQSVELQKSLGRLGQETASGLTADRSERLGGDFTGLAAIERALANLGAYRTSTSEARLFASTAQTAIGTAQDVTSSLAPTLVSAGVTTGQAQVNALANDAREKIGSVIAALNAQAGGRYVLSGAATDARPLAASEDMLAALGAAVAGETTVAGIIAAASAWFDAARGSGGFLDLAYGGSDRPLAPFLTGEGETAAVTVTAADPAIRDALKGLALAALVADGALSGDPAGRALLLRRAGEAMLSASGALTDLQAGIGSAEARIASAEDRNAAESSALALARNGLIAADPYETATALKEAEGRLEALYAITARLSRLSFTNYLD